MWFFHQLGISLIYNWFNLFKMHCVLFTNICTATGQGQVIFHYLPCFELESARSTLASYMRFPKLAPLACAQRTHRNRAIVHKLLARLCTSFLNFLVESLKTQKTILPFSMDILATCSISTPATLGE